MDEDTLLRRLDEWSKNLHALAKSICDHSTGLTDGRGHSLTPCVRCVKAVRHVTEYYFMAMITKAKAVRQRAEKEDKSLPLVDLEQGLFIASSLLDPATSVQIEEWGAA